MVEPQADVDGHPLGGHAVADVDVAEHQAALRGRLAVDTSAPVEGRVLERDHAVAGPATRVAHLELLPSAAGPEVVSTASDGAKDTRVGSNGVLRPCRPARLRR